MIDGWLIVATVALVVVVVAVLWRRDITASRDLARKLAAAERRLAGRARSSTCRRRLRAVPRRRRCTDHYARAS